MQLFPRKSKQTPNSYYFGEFDEVPLAPFSISIASFDESFKPEPKHYHEHNQKAYLTLSGAGILNVNGEKIELKPEQMIHIEAKERHFIEKVTQAPLQIVVILSSKTDDKVTVE